MSQLEELFLDDNKLTTLPELLGELKKLRNLYLATLGDTLGGNRFRKLPEVIRLLRRLEFLQVNDCHLESLPQWLAELPRLVGIELSGNDALGLPPEVLRRKPVDILDY